MAGCVQEGIRQMGSELYILYMVGIMLGLLASLRRAS